MCSIALLYLCYLPVQGQGLTLDQLIYLNGLEQLSCDAYLVERGWHFDGIKTFNSDSVSVAVWAANNTNGTQVSKLSIRESKGEKREIIYRTVLRNPFDAIRNKVYAYGMEQIGTGADNGLQTYYRDNRYNIMLELTTFKEHPNYVVSIAKHGLVKGFTVNDDGKTTREVWVNLATMEPEQARRLQMFADSLEEVNQRLQAKGRAERAAASKKVKKARN